MATIDIQKKPFFKRIRKLIGLRFSPSWVLEGRPRGSNDVLRVLFGGRPTDKAYISKRLFDGDTVEYFKGRKIKWFTDATAQRFNCDMSIMPNGGYACPSSHDTYQYLIPSWVSAEVKLTQADVEEGRSKSRRRDLRQLARNNISYELTTDKKALLEFYDDMYVPTMMSSHGESALLMGRHQMLESAKQGACQLLFIIHQQRRIAGSLIAYDGDIPRLWSCGIRAADYRYLRLGAGNAVYLCCFHYLRKCGYSRINVGLTRAFLSDGALYFKKRLGISISGISENVFALRFARPSASLRACLSMNPFIFVEGHSLYAAVFISADQLYDADSLRALWNANYLPGIEKLIINVFHDKKSEISVFRKMPGPMELRYIDVDQFRDGDFH
jgi:hypothetical protein